MFSKMSFWQLLAVVPSVVAASTVSQGLHGASSPPVLLDSAIVFGKANGTVTQYLVLPYAQPPYVATSVLQSVG